MQSTKPFSSQPRVALAGSEKTPYTAAAASAKTAEVTEPITVSVLLKPRTELDPKTLSDAGRRLSPSQFAERHGPDPASVQIIHAFAAEFGLRSEVAKPEGRCTIHLTGPEDALSAAFGVSLRHADSDAGPLRLREGAIMIPETLSGHVLAVLGLDNRPQAKAHFRIATRHTSNLSYTPVQVAELYGFPSGTSAAGQTIGLIELGGGYRPADITAYFQTLGLPAPAISAVQVDGGENAPSTASGADGEVMLDIEVAAAVAPGVALVVYFAPNTDQGFIDAISTAVHDTTHKPSVISISWGGPESSWTAQATTALDQACQAAAALGITITVACGDDGSTDGVSDGGNHVDFPASSPHVLACGGTRLTASTTNSLTIASEVAWNELAAGEGATGGGVSTIFPLPAWQAKSNVPAPTVAAGGRGTPDVAGDADPSTGYTIRVDGQTSVIGGTSAVAPLWAGLIALANAVNGRSAGFVNPRLYAATTGNESPFRDIVSGNNGAFQARPGWDPCTGLGSPIASRVIAALATEPSSRS
jgi:kumamolisin